MSLIIGVDGGGTKSTYKVFDRDKASFFEFVGNSINFHSIGTENACISFEKTLNEICKNLKSDIDSIYVGNAALGIGDRIVSSHPFLKCISKYTDNYRVVSDLYIGLKGINHVPRIFLISGTGSMGIAESEDEKLCTIGGWGYLLGDQGSGYYIGLRGIQKALKAYDGVIERSILLEKLKEYFKLNKINDIIDLIYQKKVENKVIANFAVEVHKASKKGDIVATGIIQDSVDYLLKCVTVLHEKLEYAECRLGVYGGNFQKSKMFFNLFKDKLYCSTNKIKLGFPEFTPVNSALILAGNIIGEDLKKYLNTNEEEK